MKTATEFLREEHDAILRMLDATEEVARRLGRSEHVEPKMLEDLLEFFRLFADRCHHGKEEDLLFPELEKAGMPRNQGPIAVMLHEHHRGGRSRGTWPTRSRGHVRGIRRRRRRCATRRAATST